MKKLLLTGAALMATFFYANAQQVLTSFEADETLGYTAGSDIGDYSDLWGTYNTTSQGDADSGVIVISADWASDGTQSLYWPAQNISTTNGTNINYALTAPLNFSSLALPFTISFDVVTNTVDTDNGSNFYAQLTSYDSTGQNVNTIAGFTFDFSDVIAGSDLTDPDNPDFFQGPAFAANTVNTVSYRVNADNTITYLVDGDEIGSYTPDASLLTGTYSFAFGADDFGTDWSIDNITIEGTLGTKTVLASKLSVYPNPSSNIVTISNKDNILVSGISIADINGRVVKTAKFTNVAEAQVNISDLATGVYMMTISSDKGNTTKKIVKN